MTRAASDRSKDEEQTLELLARPNLGREEITLLLIRLIQLRHSSREVTLVSDEEIQLVGVDGRSASIYVHNLLVECEQSPEHRAEIVDRYVRVLAPEGDLQPMAGDGTADIVALVRDEVYRGYVSEQDRDLITRHLVGDLWIMYALDLPESTDILKKEIASALDLDAAKLFRVGTENVGRLLGLIEFASYGECFVLECEMACYASSSLLLNEVWEEAGKLVSGDLVVAVPARDTLLITGAENAKGLRELSEQARYVTTNGHHVISDTLLRRVGKEWKVFS